MVEIHSLATNQTVHVKISSDGESLLERDVTFAELQNPDALVRPLAGNFAGALFGALNLPELPPDPPRKKSNGTPAAPGSKSARKPCRFTGWKPACWASRSSMDVSTLGEILRVELPGDISARIDEWSKP